MSPLLEKAYRVKIGETTKTTYVYDFGKSPLYGLPIDGSAVSDGILSGTTDLSTPAWIIDTGPSSSIVKYEAEYIVKEQIFVESSGGASYPWDFSFDKRNSCISNVSEQVIVTLIQIIIKIRIKGIVSSHSGKLSWRTCINS